MHIRKSFWNFQVFKKLFINYWPKIFHFTERRIEAHICICFVAYKVYKELERVIRHAAIAMSVDKVLDIAKTIITIDVRTDGVRGVSKRTLFLTEEQKAIKQLFEMDTTKGD